MSLTGNVLRDPSAVHGNPQHRHLPRRLRWVERFSGFFDSCDMGYDIKRMWTLNRLVIRHIRCGSRVSKASLNMTCSK